MVRKDICKICESPTANSLHFGAMSCKACAAFFRRTCALDITYECVNRDGNCTIYYDKRIICKYCRYKKCIEFRMERELVQSRRGKDKKEQKEKDARQKEQEKLKTILTENCSPITHTDESTREPMYYSVIQTAPGSSSSNSYDYRHNTRESSNDDIETVLNMHLKLESDLNKRRRIAFTSTSMRDFFVELCKIPYSRSDLRNFDYRTYQGYARFEYIMFFDFAQGFHGFDKLSPPSKNMLFRCGAAVDHVMTTAYLSTKLGFEDMLMVLQDGQAIHLRNALTGNEPHAASYFNSNEEFEKYK